MITLLRSMERRLIQRAELNIRHTCYPQVGIESSTPGLGFIAALNDIQFSPGRRSSPHLLQKKESITYVYRGAIAQKDSNGKSEVVQAGEFQHLAVSRGIRIEEKNQSSSNWAHIFRVSFSQSGVTFDDARSQKRFTSSERRNSLCVVASQDGRKGSLRIFHDALIYSAILDAGQHLVYELMQGRSVWLHVISGELTLRNIILIKGDGISLSFESNVSFTAQAHSEILLVDMARTSLPH